MFDWWMEETNWHTSRGKAEGEGGTGALFLCHTFKCIQLAYLSFQFPFEVNTEQSRWRYDWLNWTRLSKYYMTSHKLLGVIQTYAKCCCRQLCTHFQYTARDMHNTQGHSLCAHTQSHSVYHKLSRCFFVLFYLCNIYRSV